MGDWFWFYNYATDEGMVSFTHLLSILAIHYFFVFLLNGLFAHIVNYENLQQLIKISEANGSLPSIGRNVDRASVVLRQPQENSGTPETRTVQHSAKNDRMRTVLTALFMTLATQVVAEGRLPDVFWIECSLSKPTAGYNLLDKYTWSSSNKQINVLKT